MLKDSGEEGGGLALSSVRRWTRAQGMVPVIAQHLARPGAAQVEVAEADWTVVVSQTCDVIATKLEAKPLFEVLHCRPIPKLREGTKELRSTRVLDFEPSRETHGDLCLAAHASPIGPPYRERFSGTTHLMRPGA